MSERKRLLIIINVDWYFLLHWVDRAQAALEAGYEVHVAMGITSDENLARARALGLIVHALPLTRKSINPGKELPTFFAMRRVIKKVDPQVVHTATIKPNIYAGIIARSMKLPVVASVPGLGALYSNEGHAMKRKFLNALYRAAFRAKRGVVYFENHDDLKMMVESGVLAADRAKKIAGSGVDISQFAPSTEPASPPLRILFAARLLEDKGLDHLIAAAQMLRDAGHAVELRVAGITDEDAMGSIPLSQLERWHSEKMINWLGQRDDMASLMADVNLICLPTRYGEGIPRVLIEGASSARALVATDVPGCREIVRDGKTGILVKPGSVEDLAKALQRLIEQPELRLQFGAAGRDVVEAEYARDFVINETLSAYASVLSA